MADAPRLDHAGLCVRDLAAAEAWYCHAFGFTRELTARIEPIELDIVMLIHPSRGDRLELLYRPGSTPGLRAADPGEAALTEGFGHIAFDVANLDATFHRVVGLGARAVVAPRPSPERGVRMAFVADPEGNLVELLSRPRILGLSCGAPGGSAEILLTAALRSFANSSLVRLDDVDLDTDDAWWLWDQLVESDGLIVSTPIMSRTVAAGLKLLVDRLLGPNADAAIIEQLVALRRDGNEPSVPFRVDERVLKPRVAGFIAVGGSLTPQWKTLALPILHSTTFSMHVAVVDQVVFGGAGTPQSIVLDGAALERAARLGANVADQLGKAFDDAEYCGEPGLCPLCHLNVIELTGTQVACATCGARGELSPDGGVHWTDLDSSVITMAEKRAHAAEIQETAARHQQLRSDIDERASAFGVFDRILRP
jgi:catechol 2,3-dioxygenase-like lactoylglutathione lyase family enzyme/multimeric flavodoxin WrbA